MTTRAARACSRTSSCRPRSGCGGRSRRLTEDVGQFRSEEEVREVAADINRRIVEWRRIPVGPPIHVRLVNADDLVARWRAARKTRPAAAQPGPPRITGGHDSDAALVATPAAGVIDR